MERGFSGDQGTVEALFENLLGGANIREFTEWFPGVELEQVEEVIRHQIRTLQKGIPDERSGGPEIRSPLSS